jgi:hypothetical protein
MGPSVDRNRFTYVVQGDTRICWLCFNPQKENNCSRATFKRINVVLDMVCARQGDYSGINMRRLRRPVDPV